MPQALQVDDCLRRRLATHASGAPAVPPACEPAQSPPAHAHAAGAAAWAEAATAWAEPAAHGPWACARRAQRQPRRAPAAAAGADAAQHSCAARSPHAAAGWSAISAILPPLFVASICTSSSLVTGLVTSSKPMPAPVTDTLSEWMRHRRCGRNHLMHLMAKTDIALKVIVLAARAADAGTGATGAQARADAGQHARDAQR